METTTIIAIRDLLSQVQENIDAYQQYHKDNNTDMDACSYGSENEYCIKSIVAGIKPSPIQPAVFLYMEHC